MNKGRKGNKEVKKPKQAPAVPAPVAGATLPALVPAKPPRLRR